MRSILAGLFVMLLIIGYGYGTYQWGYSNRQIETKTVEVHKTDSVYIKSIDTSIITKVRTIRVPVSEHDTTMITVECPAETVHVIQDVPVRIVSSETQIMPPAFIDQQPFFQPYVGSALQNRYDAPIGSASPGANFGIDFVGTKWKFNFEHKVREGCHPEWSAGARWYPFNKSKGQ